jgi:hypothetical protein
MSHAFVWEIREEPDVAIAPDRATQGLPVHGAGYSLDVVSS